MRRGFEAYVPPHRRRVDNATTPKLPRTLDELTAESIHFVVQFPLGVSLPSEALDKCPFQASAGEDPGMLKVKTWRGLFEEEQLEFLHWCKTHLEQNFEIRFPTTLTKSERASWHHAVAKCDLFSHSKGIGDSRSLTVSCTTREEFGAHFAYSSLPTKTRLEVDRVYEICQLKGGYGWEVSRGEIAEMLTHPEGLSAPIRELLNKHNVNS